MRTPFLLVQLSDAHIGAEWGGRDPVATLGATVAAVRALAPRPDAVLISGDLSDDGSDAELERARELLAPIDAPLLVLAGNHDDRLALRRQFDVPGADDEPVQYAAELGPLRLLVLDTTRPGEEHGELDASRLGWLEDSLAAEPDLPTVLAMHHPPLDTGIPGFDQFGLRTEDRRTLGEIVGAHPQVRRIVAGHMHRTISAELGGRTVLAVPSTYVQARLEFVTDDVHLSADPPAFALHAFLDGELVSHVESVRYEAL